jgi:hypothetical protein
MYPGLQAFYEAVHQELFAMGQPSSPRIDPENLRRDSRASASTARLGQADDRDLKVLLRRVRDVGRALLVDDDPNYVDLLSTPIEVDWTDRPVTSLYAYWRPRISGSRRGHPRIRVSRVLCAPRAQVPDEVLEYLLWHEVLHHLLPGQGHDAEFRPLEAVWPESEKHDHFLDTLGERYDLTPQPRG